MDTVARVGTGDGLSWAGRGRDGVDSHPDLPHITVNVNVEYGVGCVTNDGSYLVDCVLV